MELLTWTPLIFSKTGFPRDPDGTPYIPGKTVERAINSALIYYYIKKDREIETTVRKLLLNKNLNPETVIEKVTAIIFEKYTHSIKFPEKIPLKGGKVFETIVDVFDLKRWEEVDSFRVEVFEGIIELKLSENLERIKPAAHSFADALLRMEMELLQDHPVVETYYQPMLNEVRKWEIPLRLGFWTQTRYQGNLLYFWRIKEIRERFLRDFKIDIRPTKILFLPREGVTAGWAEIKKEV